MFKYLWSHIIRKKRIGMEEKQKIIQLYQLYSFDLLTEERDYLVFTRPEGYFSNAEILWLKEVGNQDAIRKEYEALGYAVKVSQYSTLEETHASLFKGFFSQRNIAQRLLNEYNHYRNQHADLLVMKILLAQM